MRTDKLRQVIAYLKAGRAEINFILGFYTAYKVSGLAPAQVLSVGALGALALLILGFISIEYLSPSNQYINPWNQDFIKHRLLFVEALKTEDQETRIRLLDESAQVLSSWLKE